MTRSFLVSLLLLITPLVSSASGNVAPILNTSAPPYVKYAGYIGLWDTPEAACVDFVAHQFEMISATGLVYDHVAPSTYERYPPENFYVCFARWTVNDTISVHAIIPIRRSCNGISWVNYAITCSMNVCPANATGTPAINPTSCTCNENFEPDPAGTSCVPVDQCQPPDVIDTATGQCVQCPVAKLTNPPFAEACSTSLEAGKGVDINNRCGELTKDMQDAAACIAKKIKALSTPRIDYTTPSATIRTAEYQNHLLEIWSKSVQLDTIMNSLVYTAETKQACAQRKAEVDGELQKHAIDSPPSSSESKAPHVERRAIDVPRRVAKALIKQVTLYTTTYTTVNGKQIPTRTITSDVEDYIHSATVNPPACDSKINWGGRFKPVDRVHFQLPK